MRKTGTGRQFTWHTLRRNPPDTGSCVSFLMLRREQAKQLWGQYVGITIFEINL